MEDVEGQVIYEFSAEIARLVREFEECSLPREQWTHAAHLTVALWYLLHHPVPEATNLIRHGIQAYNQSQGIVQTKTGGYHETITLFYIRAIQQYLRHTAPDTPLVELANGLLAAWGDKRLLTRHYSRGLLLSGEARRFWFEPDRQPLE